MGFECAGRDRLPADGRATDRLPVCPLTRRERLTRTPLATVAARWLVQRVRRDREAHVLRYLGGEVPNDGSANGTKHGIRRVPTGEAKFHLPGAKACEPISVRGLPLLAPRLDGKELRVELRRRLGGLGLGGLGLVGLRRLVSANHGWILP